MQYGTYTLAERLRRLIKTRAYDTIIAVDVGGDILADKNDFETLLTPMVDLACLDIIGEMPDWISAYLAVVVPGVCGEVPRERIDDIIAESRKNHSLIDVIDFNEYSPYYKKYEMLNREINHRTGSYSHTEWMIKGIVQQKPAANIKAVYEKSYQIGKREWRIRFPVEIGKDYFNRIYFFDLKHFKSHRSHIKMKYHTVIDGFMKSRLMGTCGTEVDMSSVPLQFEKEEMKMPVFLLTPCCHTDAVQRRDIINYGLRKVTEGSIDRVLIYAKDRSLITGNVRAYSSELGEDFVLLSRNPEPSQVIDALHYSYVNSKEVFCSA
ncbi:MAG: hypothetical protein C4B58_04855 [Deltaproteobacteria bacterium]|nr:MAG: hypothetical protein C4B58_04855 [Deltaproteobacteria bacterium]